ncbi:54S ribosomal protein L6, mitochondrial [Ceratocystis lukuohia]|uniref:54S ribosomal protein L6, mitochondrial n=2 Tax=Ceratocystis TaxID=5157 RepID=A0A2C5XDT6_9PEZI|nr:54S ribosomal protein L6, mitochondrial [Ceratocystis fimbriata CBS 114723]
MLAPVRVRAARAMRVSYASIAPQAHTQPQQHSAPFSTTAATNSKLGRTALTIPQGVEVVVGEPVTTKIPTSYQPLVRRTVTVSGPLGKLEMHIPSFLQISQDAERKQALVSVANDKERKQREMWGTTWSYLQRNIMGVSEGHTAVLRLTGIGYRAVVEHRPHKAEFPGQKFLCMKLGYTHPIEMGIPQGVTVTTPTLTRVLIEGIDRELIMSFAGKIRKWRPPEPYKGKGVYINDQTIKLKQKKIK